MIMIAKAITKMKIAKQPVVVLPLKEWQKIEHSLEDLEMVRSTFLAGHIAKARKEKKTFTLEHIKEELGL